MSDISKQPVDQGELNRVIEMGDGETRNKSFLNLVSRIKDTDVLMQIAAYAEPESELDIAIREQAWKLIGNNVERWAELTRHARHGSLVHLCACVQCLPDSIKRRLERH